MDQDTGRFHIGISGWTYKPWRDNFYPAGLAVKQELRFAASRVNSIEINGTFYRLQTPKSFAHWYDETPEDFVFSLKASRYLTHIRRVKDIEDGLANFLASGIFALKEKLGPILWQFPPSYKFDAVAMRAFLSALPHDTDAGAAIASRSSLAGERALVKPERAGPLNHAVEIRHDSFRDPAFIDLLRENNVALVFADTVKWPYIEDVTGPIIYARLHGSEELYVSGYSDEALDGWATRFALWAQGLEPNDAKRIGPAAAGRTPRDVFVYFDNDVKVHAPFNAQTLAEKLKASRPGG